MKQAVQIPAGLAVSSATRVGTQKLTSLWTEDAWDAADLVAEMSEEEDGTYLPVCKDEAGNPEYLVPFTTGKRVVLDVAAMSIASVHGWLRFRSVAAGGGADVNQTVAVNIHLDLK